MRVFSFGTSPVFVHWSVLLVLPFGWAVTGRFGNGLVWFLAFLLLMLVHELGHAVVARRFGVRVQSVQLHAFHGLCVHEMPKSARVEIAISWGGVLAQALLLGVALAAVELITSAFGRIPAPWSVAAKVLIRTNLVVIIINLLPIAPLDGATAWRVLPLMRSSVRDFLRRRQQRRSSKSIVASELNRIATIETRKPD
jgi:stage IV sporulation protein FB